jgi:energy-coupling factor transport system ATP-binding protein
MSALEVQDLHYRYPRGREKTLRGIDLRVEPGEIVRILGLNGSGKSTLLSAIAGLLWEGDREGAVLLDGRTIDFLDPAERVRSLGFVGESRSSGLFGSTAAEEAVFPLENLGVPQSDMIERVDFLFDRLGISDLRNRRVCGLSEGEAQVVQLASALSADPALLLLDEPTLFLDASRREVFWNVVRDFSRDGKAVLAVSSAPESECMADRTLLLQEGALVPLSDPEDIDRACAVDDRFEPMAFEPLSGGRLRPLFEVEGLCFGYPARAALLKDLSYRIGSDERVYIDGPMGSGKTTLCRLLLGFLRPEEGRVRLEGKDVHRADSRVALRVGYLSQSPETSFYSDSVREEIRFGVDVPEDLPDFLLRAVNLEDRAGDPPLTLSRGERRRLALACALVKEPEFLVLDDPFTGLDPVESHRISGHLRAFSESGRGLLMTGKAPEELETLFDRVGRIDRGTVHFD